MLLESMVLLFGVVSALGNNCVCESNETCCPGPNQSEVNCCPFKNAVCCEDGIHCCPEDSFCDLDVRMCGMFVYPQDMRKRTGDIEDGEEVTIDPSTHQHNKRDTIEQDYINEITHIDHMLVHCDLNQFCPYFSTCCRVKEDNVSLCCPNPEGVCCSDEEHCCKQGEECDSRGVFCLSEIGLETMVRKADDLKYHYEKRGLDFVEPYAIKGKASNHSE